MIRVHPIGPELEVVDLGEGPTPSRDVRARVDQEWKQAVARHALHDGWIFSVSEHGGSALHGHFVPYRQWTAQLRAPELHEALRVRPLGVTGLTRAGDSIVFGRRAATALLHPGIWELAPSGGVDPSAADARGRVSIHGQALGELREELGIEADGVRSVVPFALVEDTLTRVLDLAVELELRATAQDLQQQLSRPACEEYDELRCVAASDLEAFLREQHAQIDAVSRHILVERGLVASGPAVGTEPAGARVR